VATLFIAPRRSLALAGLLIVAHLLAGAALWPLALAPWLKLALALPIAFSAFASVRQHALRLGDAVPVGLTFHADGHVTCEWRSGHRCDVRVADDSTVTPWLIVLRLLPTEGRRRPCVCLLPADSLPADEHRRLRVWLRWRAAPALSVGPAA